MKFKYENETTKLLARFSSALNIHEGVDVIFQGPATGGGPQLYLNDGDNTFSASYSFGDLGAYERSIVLADINNDGRRDVFFTLPIMLFENDTGSSFTDITAGSQMVNANPEGAAALFVGGAIEETDMVDIQPVAKRRR